MCWGSAKGTNFVILTPWGHIRNPILLRRREKGVRLWGYEVQGVGEAEITTELEITT